MTLEAINAIRKITGTEKSCLSFGYESERYRILLNSLFSSAEFINFIECLHDLDSITISVENMWKDIENRIGKECFEEAFQLYESPIDYKCNPDELTSEQYEAINMIDIAIDKQHELEYSIKIARYELHESFEAMVGALYPRNK